MNARHGFGQQMIIPIMVCLIFVSGFVIYRHNKLIMTQTPMLTELTNTKVEQGVGVTISPVAEVTGVAPAAVSPVNKLPLKIDDQFQSIELSGKSDHWSQQDDLIIQSSSQSISVYGLDGAKLWSFGIPDELTFSEGLPATSKNTLWATTVDGRVYAMDLRSGALHWYRNGEEKYLRMPLLSGDRLLMFVDMKHNMTWSLQVLDSASGRELSSGGEFDLPFAGPPVVSASGTVHYTTTTGHVVAIDVEKKSVLWSNEGSPSFRARPTLTDDKLFAVNEDGIVFQFDRKTGKKAWEIELGTTIHSPVAVLPAVQMGFVIDVQGYLIGLDLKGGKRKWRHFTNQIGPDREISIIKVSGDVAENLSKEAKKHYVAVGCASEKLCLFDPINGYLLYRLASSGTISTALKGIGPEAVFAAARSGRTSRILKLISP